MIQKYDKIYLLLCKWMYMLCVCVCVCVNSGRVREGAAIKLDEYTSSMHDNHQLMGLG